jgi:hypothetical protein
MTLEAEIPGALFSLGLQVGRWVFFLAPVLGLLVFWLFPFKSAVTLYVAIVGLGIVLLKVVELQRLSFEIDEIVRRKLNEYYAR